MRNKHIHPLTTFNRTFYQVGAVNLLFALRIQNSQKALIKSVEK